VELTKVEKDIAAVAYMCGRVYNQGGEKKLPAEAFEEMIIRCGRAKVLSKVRKP